MHAIHPFNTRTRWRQRCFYVGLDENIEERRRATGAHIGPDGVVSLFSAISFSKLDPRLRRLHLFSVARGCRALACP